MEQAHEIYGINFIHKKDAPVKSSDESPLDFFGFSYLKQQLKQHEVSSIDQLCTSANQIWTEIPLEMVLNVFRSWRKRLILIPKYRGKHITCG